MSLRPTTWVATAHRPIAITSWQASFVRAERPSERALTIFSQSSANPIKAHPNAVPNTARLAASRLERIRYGIPIAVKITRPPIVGVPAFVWCSAGPSSRMCWPNSLVAQELDVLGAQEDRDEERGEPRDQDLPH